MKGPSHLSFAHPRFVFSAQSLFVSLPSSSQAADNTRVQWESLLPPTEAGLSSTSGLIFVNRTHFSPLCIGPDSLSTALYRSAFSPPHPKWWRCVVHRRGCAEIIAWNHPWKVPRSMAATGLLSSAAARHHGPIETFERTWKDVGVKCHRVCLLPWATAT